MWSMCVSKTASVFHVLSWKLSDQGFEASEATQMVTASTGTLGN